MADALDPFDPAALADVIRRCEAAVASWGVDDIETRALLGECADFPTAIRDAAPLVLAVERHVRGSTPWVSPGAAASSPREVPVAPSAGDDVSESSANAATRRRGAGVSPPPRAAAAERSDRRGATVVELCGPERGRLLGWLVRALLPVESVAEVVLVDAARRRREKKEHGAGPGRKPAGSRPKDPEPEDPEPEDPRPDARANAPALTTHRANIKNGSHLRSLAESLRRATRAERRNGIVFVARRLAGTASLRACQLFDAACLDATSVALLLEPGPAPPKDASLKSKLLFRVARAHACAARQLYPAPERDAREARDACATTSSGRLLSDARDAASDASSAASRAAARRAKADADAEATFFAHVVAGLRTVPGAEAVAVASGATRFAVARRARSKHAPSSRDVSSRESTRDAFGAVAWTVTEQMAQLNAAVARRLGEADGYVRPRSAATRGAATAVLPFFEFESPPLALANAPGASSRVAAGYALRRVAANRWSQGGYAAEHYVEADPGPHGVCYEAVCVDARGAALPGAAREGVGFVSIAAHERGDRENRDEARARGSETDVSKATDGREAPFGRLLTHATIERLCVKDGFRGVGVARTLLRAADGFHACGVPVRVKTASERARASFAKMPDALAFVGFKDPTIAGVNKTRAARTVVVVDDASGAGRGDARIPPRWGSNPEDARAYARDGWGKRPDARLERDEERADDASARTRRRVDDAVRETVAAMNRAAPDTVDACAARVSRAVSASRGASFSEETETREATVAARAAGAAFARRAAREPTYAATHARVLTRVASRPFRERAIDATLQTLRRLCDASSSVSSGGHDAEQRELTRPSRDAEGAAAFVAALVAERVDEGDGAASAERARVVEATEATLARLGDVADTSSAALFALCAAIERGALANSGAATVAATRERLRTIAERRDAAGDGSGTVSRAARFAAERARDALGPAGAGDAAPDLGTPVSDVEPRSGTAPSPPARVGFGRGRGRAFFFPQAQSRAETHAAAEAEAAGRRAGGGENRRVPGAGPLRVAVEGTVAAVERGMRRGWVFRYVGSDVAPGDVAYWTE